ncbi:MAG: hypothetical protein RPU64_04805 [Candidatus Sedimenticola sp. (ex Thyasira tokunagai)]
MDEKYRRANMLLAVLLFFTNRKKYLELAVTHAVALNFDNHALIEKFEEGDQDFINKTEERIRHDSTEMSKVVDISLWISFFYILLVSIIAFSVAYISGSINFSLPLEYSKVSIFIGTILVAWPTLMELGGKLQTWGGESLPELTHKVIFKILFIPGACLLLIGAAL